MERPVGGEAQAAQVLSAHIRVGLEGQPVGHGCYVGGWVTEADALASNSDFRRDGDGGAARARARRTRRTDCASERPSSIKKA